MIEIPARRGKAAHLRRGQIVEVINTTGQQVVDTWAFSAADLGEFMAHSCVAIGHIRWLAIPSSPTGAVRS